MRKRFLPGLICLLALGGPARTDEQQDEKNALLVRQLVLALGDASGRTPLWSRVQAAETLGKLGPVAGSGVPALAALLEDPARKKDPPVIDEAIVKALGRIGRPARSAIPALVRASGRSFDLEQAVVEAVDAILLSPFGDSSDVPTLLRNLRDRDVSTRMRAAKMLGDLGPPPRAAAPYLAEALKDPDRDVRRLALQALHRIVPREKPTEPEVEIYVQDLQDPDEAVRLHAAKALARLGPLAEPAIPALQEATNDPDRDVRHMAQEALQRIAPR